MTEHEATHRPRKKREYGVCSSSRNMESMDFSFWFVVLEGNHRLDDCFVFYCLPLYICVFIKWYSLTVDVMGNSVHHFLFLCIARIYYFNQ